MQQRSVSLSPQISSFCLSSSCLLTQARVIYSDIELFFLFTDLEECESYLLELNLLLKSMEVLHRTCSAPAIGALQV